MADRGLGGHSPFAYFLLKLLRENTHPYLVPSTIHEALAPLVANNTNQVPRSEPLTQSGDEGGQFVFRLTATPGESPTPPIVDLTPYQQLQQQTEYQTELEKAWSIVQKFVKTPGFTTDQRIKALKQFERDFPTANPYMKEAKALSFNLALQQMLAKETEPPKGAKKYNELDMVYNTKLKKWQYPAGDRFRDCPECPEMVVVPAGSYEMGSPSSEAGRDDDEGPVHQVTIAKPFAVGKYEVTFDEWDACVAAAGCTHRTDDLGWGRGIRPVHDISWEDAQEYVQWVSRETGKPYRLLNEAEWEYVARAGNRTKYWWGDNIDTNNANCSGCGSQWDGKSTAPVGSFKENAFGLFDTAGNVWEWTQDCWIYYRYKEAKADGKVWCSRRVLRGGSWIEDPSGIRSANRDKAGSGSRSSSFGFRVARTLD